MVIDSSSSCLAWKYLTTNSIDYYDLNFNSLHVPRPTLTFQWVLSSVIQWDYRPFPIGFLSPRRQRAVTSFVAITFYYSWAELPHPPALQCQASSWVMKCRRHYSNDPRKLKFSPWVTVLSLVNYAITILITAPINLLLLITLGRDGQQKVSHGNHLCGTPLSHIKCGSVVTELSRAWS